MTTDVFTGEVVASSSADLVGEGKKFKSVDDLVKGKAEADAFIEQLKGELQGLRAQVDAAASAKDQLEQLRNELKQQRQEIPATQPKAHTGPALTASDIEALVERTITSREQGRTANQNIEDANQQAIRHYGSAEAAHNAVKARAAALKIPVKKLAEIASESPTGFMEILGVKVSAPAVGSFVQPSAGAPDKEHVSAQEKPGTYEFAENIRRTDPRKYWTPSFQQKYVWEATKAGTYKPN